MSAGIKKFLFSINLMGNKIFNGKVETPIDSEHISNKDYVDGQQIYITTKSTEHLNPFNFSWITNATNKTFKQILDDLFFPRILPTFTNPLTELVSLEFTDYQQNINSSALIFDRQTLKINLVIKITNNDRLPLDLPSLKIYNNETLTVHEPTSVDGEFVYYNDIEFIYNSETAQFLISQNFDIAESKLDTYGDSYLESGFEIIYLSEINFITEILEKLIIEKSLMFRNHTTEEWYGDPDTVSFEDGVIPDSFIYTKRLYFNEGIEGIFDILIPKDFLPANNYMLVGEIYDNSDSTPKLINKIQLNDILVEYDITFDNQDWYSEVEYQYHQINFGYYDTNIMIITKFELINKFTIEF